MKMEKRLKTSLNEDQAEIESIIFRSRRFYDLQDSTISQIDAQKEAGYPMSTTYRKQKTIEDER